MALINCTECGKEISDMAAMCPNCGISITQKTQKKTIPKKTLFCIGTGVAVIVIIAILFSAGVLGVSGAERQALNDIRTLQRALLEPDSIIIYEVAVINNIGIDDVQHWLAASGTLVHYGARNRGGGISDDWVFILGRHISSLNSMENAQAINDRDEMREHINILWARRKVFGSLLESNPDIIILDNTRIQDRVR